MAGESIRARADSDLVPAAKTRAGWLSILVGALLCALVIILWWTLERREQASLAAEVQVEARNLTALVDSDMRSRILVLKRMARAWERRGGVPRDEFLAESRMYLADTPGFQALEWVDRDYYVRWVAPIEGNENAVDFDLSTDPMRRLALERAKDSGALTVSTAVNLLQGGKGFVVHLPLEVHGEFDGFIVAVFRAQEWLDQAFRFTGSREAFDDFAVSASLDGVPMFEHESPTASHGSTFIAQADTWLNDRRLEIEVRPSQAFLSRAKTQLPNVTAACGIVLSLLVAFVVELFIRAYREALRTNAIRAALEREASERQRTANELERAMARLAMATKAGCVGVWTWDLSTNNLIWNRQMYELYDVPEDVLPVYETWRSAVHRDDIEAAERLLKDAVAGKAIFKTEFRIGVADGRTRYIGAAARVERDESGQPSRVTGINLDLTDRKKAEEALIQSEERVRLLLNSTAEAIYGIDMQGNCTFANHSFLRMLDYPDERSVLGRNVHALIHHSHADGTPIRLEDCAIFRAFRNGVPSHRTDECLWTSAGTPLPVEYWSYPQSLNGQIVGAVVTFYDITERKRVEQALAAERSRLANVIAGTHVGIWEWNVPTGELVMNHRGAEIVGYALEELSPITIETKHKLLHPEDLEKSKRLTEAHFRRELEYYDCEVRMRHKNGSWVWVLDRGKVVSSGPDGQPLVMSGTYFDITDKKNAEEQLRHMATHDLLTNLPTLRLAKDRLSMALGLARRNATGVAVLFVDLDGFKTINDTYGHDAGDYVLTHVSQQMRGALRETDTVARIGGDEFLIVAAGIATRESAAIIADKTIRAVSKPAIMNGARLCVNASVGIALSSEVGEDMDRLIKSADEAMYRAKTTGKGRYCFAEASRAEAYLASGSSSQ